MILSHGGLVDTPGGCAHDRAGARVADGAVAPARNAYSGSRLSGPRQVILEAVHAMTGAFTIDELARAVRTRRAGVGTATVYRAVASMEASGYLESVGARGGSALYARCDECGHHHHLVCTGCGAVATAECDLLGTIERASREVGFTVTDHELNVYGLCAECSKTDTEA